MCEAKPGCRCAGDTRGVAVATLERYTTAHPQGPSVDPLTAAEATHTSPSTRGVESYIAEADGQVAAAEQRVATAQAKCDQAARASADARAKAQEVRGHIDKMREQAWPHVHQTRLKGEAALSQARALYEEHGVNPRLIGYYLSDMREAAGLVPGQRAWSGSMRPANSIEELDEFRDRPELRIKVKRNGPDAGPTRAAAQAAQTHEGYQAAYGEYMATRTAAMDLINGADDYEMANQDVLDGEVTAIRQSMAAEQELHAAKTGLASAKDDAERVRARARAGVPMEGRHMQAGPELRNHIHVAADGSTNLWHYQPPVHDEPAKYEPVTAVAHSSASGMAQLQGPDGVKIRQTRHYANYTSTVTAPEVWVGPPAAGSRPVTEVYRGVALESSVDSGD